jgi:hypothetical protein
VRSFVAISVSFAGVLRFDLWRMWHRSGRKVGRA